MTKAELIAELERKINIEKLRIEEAFESDMKISECHSNGRLSAFETALELVNKLEETKHD